MKKLILPALSVLSLSMLCSNVFAVDGTITVNGVVTDQTCTFRGGDYATGIKDLTVNLPAIPKSEFTPTIIVPMRKRIEMILTNATGTDSCDAATTKAFRGIHLSASSPADLDTTDKSLLVNKAGGASATNPVFIQMYVDDGNGSIVDFSAPWESQAKTQILTIPYTSIAYYVGYTTKSGIVDAQNVTATVNYTMHYN